jgi:hypothetical protein
MARIECTFLIPNTAIQWWWTWCIFTAASGTGRKELRASASTLHSFCISSLPPSPRPPPKLNHQVNGFLWARLKPAPPSFVHGTLLSGAAGCSADKESQHSPQVGSRLKCVELVSTTYVPASVSVCDGLRPPSLLRTSHRREFIFSSSGYCYRVPFRSSSSASH